MANAMKKYEIIKLFNGSSDLLELFCWMAKYFPPKHQLILWNWKKEFGKNSPVSMKVKLNLEDAVHQDKCNKAHNINDRVFNLDAIYTLLSGFLGRHEILMPFNIFCLYFHLFRSLKNSADLVSPQKYIILLPFYEAEYASKFYSLRKIDSLFCDFNFKVSRILELSKTFPDIEDFYRRNYQQIVASSSTNKLVLHVNEKCSDSICGICLTCRKTKFEKKQNSYLRKSDFKPHSVKSRNYCVDLMKTYNHLRFPVKGGINAFRKKGISTKRFYNAFTKNRQFKENILYRNYQCLKRCYFAKDATRTITDDCLSENGDVIENCDETYSNIQENSTHQEIAGKHVKSKIAEVRQNIINLSRGMNYELIRMEQNRVSFIKRCKQISDSTVSSEDYNKLYHIQSLQSEVKVSLSDDIFYNSLSDLPETANFCNEALHRSKTLNSSNKVPKQTEPVNPFSEVFYHDVSNSTNRGRNQSESLNFSKQIRNLSEVSGQKYSSYLEILFGNFRHQITIFLGVISVPFAAVLLSKK